MSTDDDRLSEREALTGDEREAMADAFVAANRAEFLDWCADGINNPDDPDLPILHAVERIVAARERAAERRGAAQALNSAADELALILTMNDAARQPSLDSMCDWLRGLARDARVDQDGGA